MDRTPVPARLTSSYCPADRRPPLIEDSIGNTLLTAAAQFGDRLALLDGQANPAARRRWTFADLAEQSQRVAHALLQHFEPGEHVALWSSNRPEWLLVEFGAALAGLVLVTVNPAYQIHEVTHVLRQSRASGVIVEDAYRGRNLPEMLEAARAELPDLRVVIPLSAWEDLLTAARPTPLPQVSPHAIAQIQYTSGTTGFPKGACLTHRGLGNNGRFYAEAIGRDERDVWINAMPMFHTAGCGLATLGAMQTGGAHVMTPGFDAGLMLDLFEQVRGTVMLCVPTMLIRMLEEQAREPRDLSSWRLVTLGGAPVAAELVRKAEDMLGLKVAIGFGQTEASPYLTHTAPGDPHPAWFETVGRALPHTEIKIVDPSSGAVVPLGATGEICGRGYGVMHGYHDAEAATQAAIDGEGWLHTGDLGSLDAQGYCRVLGRLRDMIIRGGENIYPREVEDVLLAHPGVADVAVVGLPDAEWGEAVAACVRLAGPATAEDLEAFCRQRLAGYKVPRRWRFLEAFPQTASGKVQKFALREQLLAEARDPPG